MFFSFIINLFKGILFSGSVNPKNTFPKPLSPEEEKHYLTLAKQGDKNAKDILIKHNMRLVAHIVKKYNSVAETDDLISVGSIGLIKAINTYEFGRGTQLATYTARCIENEILMMLRNNKKHKNDVSLNEPIGVDKDGNELMIMDLLAEKEDGVFKSVELSILKQKFLVILKRVLSDREFKIVSLRYGLLDGVPLPQREVAMRLKISRSYVSRIEKKSLEKLKVELKKCNFFAE